MHRELAALVDDEDGVLRIEELVGGQRTHGWNTSFA